MWQNWINAILGIWIILSPFVGMSASTMTTNLMIVGAVITVFGLWGAYSATRDFDDKYSRHTHA